METESELMFRMAIHVVLFGCLPFFWIVYRRYWRCRWAFGGHKWVLLYIADLPVGERNVSFCERCFAKRNGWSDD